MKAPLRALLAPTLLLLLLPLLLLWPLPVVSGSHLLAARGQEAAVHAWGLWAAWAEGALLVIETDLLTWPVPTSIVLIDPANVLPYAAGHALGGAAGGYNLTLYVGAVVMGLAGWLLARRAGGDPLLGIAAAQACPAFVAAPAAGMTEEFGVGWAVIFLVSLLGFVERGGGGRGALCAALLALCWYTGPYTGLFASGMGLAVGLAQLRQPQPKRLWRAAAAGAGGVLLVLPLARAILLERHQALPGTARPWVLPAPAAPAPGGFRGGLSFGGDLLDPLLPIQLTGGEAAVSHTTYLGLISLVLALVALRRWRSGWPWLLGALGCVVLSLGPYLHFRGELVTIGGRPLLMPAGMLLLLASPLGQVTRWNRIAVIGHLLLVPLISRLGGRRLAARLSVGVLLVADVVLLAPLQWPLHHSRPPPAADYAGMAEDGALLEVPLHSIAGEPPLGMWTDGSVLAQTHHRHPIGGSVMQLPISEVAGDASLVVGRMLRGRPLSSADHVEILDAGFRYLAVYPRLFPTGPELLHRLEGCFGPPLQVSELVILHDLRGRGVGGCFE